MMLTEIELLTFAINKTSIMSNESDYNGGGSIDDRSPRDYNLV